jgi:hypothetical protein
MLQELIRLIRRHFDVVVVADLSFDLGARQTFRCVVGTMPNGIDVRLVVRGPEQNEMKHWGLVGLPQTLLLLYGCGVLFFVFVTLQLEWQNRG